MTDTNTTENEENRLEFQDSIGIDTSKTELWKSISDPTILTKCIPGAEEVNRISKRKYSCDIKRGISHLTVSLSGEFEFIKMNEPDWIIAEGNVYDSKTGSSIHVLSAMEMEDAKEGTVNLSYHADVSISGGIASLGTSVLRPFVESDIDTYFDNIKDVVEPN
ncbi:MAG: CoxG family protein [Halobacteriaceae archaeon]